MGWLRPKRRMNMSNTIQVTEQVVCINIDCSIWSGRKKLTPADFKNLESDSLPPSDLASLGSKKICNPEALRDFDTLKKEAHREAAKVGIRFLGGYAVPSSKAGSLGALLDDVRERFNKARDIFVGEYDDEIEAWIKKHPGWENSIRAAIPSVSHVEGRISFDYQAFEIKADGITSAGLERAVGGLADQLYLEVSKEAYNLYDVSICGKPHATQRTLRPLHTIRSKLEGLSFIDPKVTHVISMIDHVLIAMPTSGKIEGTSLSMLTGIVLTLSDAERIKACAERMMNGASAASVLNMSGDDDVTGDMEQPIDTAASPALVDFGSLFAPPATHAAGQHPVLIQQNSALADVEQQQDAKTNPAAPTVNAPLNIVSQEPVPPMANTFGHGIVGAGSLAF